MYNSRHITSCSTFCMRNFCAAWKQKFITLWATGHFAQWNHDINIGDFNGVSQIVSLFFFWRVCACAYNLALLCFSARIAVMAVFLRPKRFCHILHLNAPNSSAIMRESHLRARYIGHDERLPDSLAARRRPHHPIFMHHGQAHLFQHSLSKDNAPNVYYIL